MADKGYTWNRARIGAEAEKVVTASMRIMELALSNLDEADPLTLMQVRADARLPQGEAPFYLHAASKVAAAAMAASGDDERPKQVLNVLVMGKSTSAQDWMDAAKDFRKLSAVEATAKKVTPEGEG